MSTNAPDKKEVYLSTLVAPPLAKRFHAVRKRLPYPVSASAFLAKMIEDCLPLLEKQYPEGK